jgi:Protein of unknown function (DUF2785)
MKLQLNKTPLNENELKRILIDIKSGEKEWNDVDRILVVNSMINHIGSTDAELRDQLVYTSFFRMIIEDNQLEAYLLIELLDISLSQLLYKGVGEIGTDSVFTRSFTTLLIALILYRDNKENFLTQTTIEKVKDQLIQYIKNEKDLRGYVPGKGWAHSVAHAADTFDELVKNPKISGDLYPEILQPLWSKMFVSDSVYIHHEDERMVTPIVEMLNNGMEVEEIERLLQNIPAEMKAQKEYLAEEEYWFLIFNCKAFLKSFYVKINGESKFDSIQKSIERCLYNV